MTSVTSSGATPKAPRVASEGRRAVEPVDLGQLGRELSAEPAVHQDAVLNRSDKRAVESERDPVLLVGGARSGPQRLGDDSEHGPAVEAKRAVGGDRQLERTDPPPGADGVRRGCDLGLGYAFASCASSRLLLRPR